MAAVSQGGAQLGRGAAVEGQHRPGGVGRGVQALGVLSFFEVEGVRLADKQQGRVGRDFSEQGTERFAVRFRKLLRGKIRHLGDPPSAEHREKRNGVGKRREVEPLSVEAVGVRSVVAET